MKKFAKIMLIALGVGLIAGVIGVLTSRPTTAQLPPAPLPVVPVKVTNTPLPVQGTVAVSSLPPVTVSGLSSVTVGNGATNPVLVSNVNDSADREFFFSLCQADYNTPVGCFGSFDPAFNQIINSFTVPTTTTSGLKVTRAVIEYASGICRADATDDIAELGIEGTFTNNFSEFAPVKTPGTQFPIAPPQPSPTTWSWSNTTKIYAYPGASINLGQKHRQPKWPRSVLRGVLGNSIDPIALT